MIEFKVSNLIETETNRVLIESRSDSALNACHVDAFDLEELSPNGKYVLVRDMASESMWVKVEDLENPESNFKIVDVLE